MVSTSAGLEDTEERQLREANDLRLARELRETGVEAFVAKWYELDLWKNLRARPWFSTMLANRISCNMHGKDSLARVLEVCSPTYETFVSEWISGVEHGRWCIVGNEHRFWTQSLARIHGNVYEPRGELENSGDCRRGGYEVCADRPQAVSGSRL